MCGIRFRNLLFLNGGNLLLSLFLNLRLLLLGLLLLLVVGGVILFFLLIILLTIVIGLVVGGRLVLSLLLIVVIGILFFRGLNLRSLFVSLSLVCLSVA